MAVTFKKCTQEDLDILLEISKQTFIDAFQEFNDPVDFANYLAKAFAKDKIKEELLNPNSAFYFIVAHKLGLVGYLKLNKKEAQHEQFDMDALELQRIYITKEHQGQQLGRDALMLVIDMAKTQKASCVWLGVWEHNTRAIAFYQRHGFVKFGEHPYLIGEDEQYDWMMKLDLV